MTPQEKSALVGQWNNAKLELARAKDRELALREKVINTMFPVQKIGTNNLLLGKGFKLSLVTGIKYEFMKDDETTEAQTAEAFLNEFCVNDVNGFIAKRLIRWTPEVSKSEYSQMEPEQKIIADKYLVSKPISPQLKLIEPK